MAEPNASRTAGCIIAAAAFGTLLTGMCFTGMAGKAPGFSLIARMAGAATVLCALLALLLGAASFVSGAVSLARLRWAVKLLGLVMVAATGTGAIAAIVGRGETLPWVALTALLGGVCVYAALRRIDAEETAALVRDYRSDR